MRNSTSNILFRYSGNCKKLVQGWKIRNSDIEMVVPPYNDISIPALSKRRSIHEDDTE
jgi:hypothetical protein